MDFVQPDLFESIVSELQAWTRDLFGWGCNDFCKWPALSGCIMCYGLDHCRCNNRITLSFKKVQHIPPFNSDLLTLGKLNHTNLKHPEADFIWFHWWGVCVCVCQSCNFSLRVVLHPRNLDVMNGNREVPLSNTFHHLATENWHLPKLHSWSQLHKMTY